tara:strand:- start:3135 stop:3950 length:816 start_codon:yes stop_codon:yes gene_type:complete
MDKKINEDAMNFLKNKLKNLIILFIVLPLISCSIDSQNDSDIDEIIDNAIQNSNRAENNSSRDDQRKPAEILKFAELKPAMTVLDLVSNGGYYAEMIASIVGKKGNVIAHTFTRNNSNPDFDYDDYVNESEHMSNVSMMYADFDEINIQENTLDRVFIVQNYHDLYFDRPGYGVDDVQPVLAMIRKGLKPGGLMIIIDHDAEKGAPSSTGTTLHRISDEIVMNDMKAAGFEFIDNIHVLKNDWEDDLSKSVFDESVRGNTSRFVHKYRSPD